MKKFSKSGLELTPTSEVTSEKNNFFFELSKILVAQYPEGLRVDKYGDTLSVFHEK